MGRETDTEQATAKRTRAARKHNALTALSIKSASKQGYYADGNGLYLQISKSGTKSWIFRYRHSGKAREMGLGSIHDTELAAIRARVTALREQVANGIDPLIERQKRQLQQQQELAALERQRAIEAAKAVTFNDCVERYLSLKSAGWKSDKHRQQWRNTLEQYASPTIGHLPVGEIDTGLVLQVLEPIWQTKTETATRVRQRIETILDHAKALGLRTGENPARWKGHLSHSLPSPAKLKKNPDTGEGEHHSALPYVEIHAFMSELRQRQGIASLALQFTILTATRTGEAIGAQWSEVDLERRVWTIPAIRMKAGREHAVPLSEAAMGVIKQLQAQRQGGYLFPGQKHDRPISNMAMLTLLRRMGRGGGITVHGFRSTFRDWAADKTHHESFVVEMALAHAIPNAVEQAYRRGNLLEKRVRLMADWASYIDTPQGGNVLAFEPRESVAASGR